MHFVRFSEQVLMIQRLTVHAYCAILGAGLMHPSLSLVLALTGQQLLELLEGGPSLLR